MEQSRRRLPCFHFSVRCKKFERQTSINHVALTFVLSELLQLDFNYFSGTIPLQMGFMFSLSKYRQCVDIMCSGVAAQRTIIEWLTLCYIPELLDIGDNKLTGTIPPELGRLSRLGTLAILVTWVLSRHSPAIFLTLSEPFRGLEI